MLWLGVALLAVIFLPNLWVKWVMNAYGRDLEGMPGTGGELANHLVERFGLSGVEVEETNLGDHYDPIAKRVRLSEANFRGRSLTAVAVAAHEVGHAMQDHQQDARLRWRTKLLPLADVVARVGAAIIWAAPIIGLVTKHPVPFFALALLGLSGLIMRMLIHLLTLPIEWDASFGKALPVLQAGDYIGKGQQGVVRRILTAAALTYVAAALADVLNLLRWGALIFRR